MIGAAILGRARLQLSSAVNLVWDGNSLVAGVGATGGQTLPAQVAALAPVAGKGIVTTNVGIGGQNWTAMNSAAGDVDGAWVAGKTNVLLLWETTNYVVESGFTGLQAMAAMQAYIAARRAAHPWVVAMLTTLPRESGGTISDQTTRTARNLELAAADDYAKANRASLGLDQVIDIRQQGSPFAFANYTPASFDATQAYWSEAANIRVHLNNAGYGVVAGYVAAALPRLPRKAR